MLVLLPPSETKSEGGTTGPLDLALLSYPELTATRSQLVDALVRLAGDVPASRAALGLTPGQDAEVGRNAALRTSATTPALLRYTGVLYDALGVPTWTRAQRARAAGRLRVASALFGLLAPTDPVPAYRFSAGSTLPGTTGLRTTWRPLLTPLLAGADELVVDLRSGAYAALGPAPAAVRVQVLSERADGTRAVVSHHNKAHKGLLARALAHTRAEPRDVRGVARVARTAGLAAEVAGPTELVIVVAG